MEKSRSSVVANLDPSQLWYAPNPRLGTKAAGAEAKAVCNWIRSTQPGADHGPDEESLFAAMHVCAYLVRQKLRQGKKGAEAAAVWFDNWQTIREFIVERNMGLVYAMIGRTKAENLDPDELLSEGLYALARAIDRFNPWKGFRFSTYACNVISRSMMRSSRQKSTHVSRMMALQNDRRFHHLGEVDERTELYVERLRRALRRNLGDLTDLESEVLAQRFPPDRESRLTFREIASRVGLSKERVRQIQNRALGKLREVLEVDPVLQ